MEIRHEKIGKEHRSERTSTVPKPKSCYALHCVARRSSRSGLLMSTASEGSAARLVA